MICQDHARLVVEIYRRVLVMIDDLVKHEHGGIKESVDEVQKIRSEAITIKLAIIKELRTSRTLLFNREDFYRLVVKQSEVIDHAESVGVRIGAIEENNWKIPSQIGVNLSELADAAFDALIKLRESLISLGFNSERSLVLTSELDELERKVDVLYRILDLSIITSQEELPLIFILRDVSMKLEEMIDAAVEEADLIRILAL
ncbi:MAG: DUF47 family protein [Candidatus Bathyarchaeota archaeon]|nr:DUF47 family protein [Candidatus Bathyarchaeota archaeon]